MIAEIIKRENRKIRKEGREEGRKETIKMTVENLIKLQVDDTIIIQATGICERELQQIREKTKNGRNNAIEGSV